LHSLTDPGTEAPGTTGDSGVAIGIGPIELPEYLNRPQIVTRVNPNEVEFAEFHRWAASLKDDFSSTLARNLSNLLATDRVAAYPWTSKTPVDVQVKIDVIRFDGRLGKSVVLETTWALFGEDRTKPLLSRGSVASEQVDKSGYEGLVEAQSRAIAGLSREIAGAIRALPRDEPIPSSGGD
jgi:uncharacterized lipoprotein YmbA